MPLSVEHVSVRFGDRIALDDVSLSLEAGQTVAVIGPNGSGKTTLLRVLAGLQRPTKGVVHPGEILGAEPVVAFVAQLQHQHQWMPLAAGDVVEMGTFRRRGLLGRITNADRLRCADAAHQLGVTDLLAHRFGDLSGGQRQRVLLASALASEPTLLLLDEPLTGLDPPSIEAIHHAIETQRERGCLVVESTHHLDDARRCDQVVLLDRSVIAAGAPPKVLTPETLRLLYATATAGNLVIMDDHGHGHHSPT